MFEPRVIIIQLGLFISLLMTIFGTIKLKNNGITSRDSLDYLIPFEMISCAVIGWTLIGRYQRKKTFRHLIEDDLRDQGYELVSERPLKLKEMVGGIQIAPTILINGMPIESYAYKARNERMLHVRTTQGDEFLFHAVITKTWRNKIKLDLVKKVQLD
jgi:hypothetical protein